MSDGMRISMMLTDLSEERLNFYRQIGVEEVTMPVRYATQPIARPIRPLVPPAQMTAHGPVADPDHTPGINGDSVDTRIGWAFAVGHMLALMKAVEGDERSKRQNSI
ncbi:MAG: hypothetical protein O7E52_01775 [Candidatus Poribacteria bacterium]|nr:hypothetical protein [Candidatus Poribacteria bacterium]